VFHRQARALRDEWTAAARAGAAIDVTTGTSEFALRSLLEALFGEPVADGDALLALARDHARDLGFARRFRALRPHCARRIDDALAAGRAHALLSLLAVARDDVGAPFTADERIDEVMTFVVAGHETTATALTWALLLLAEHADAASMLHRELDAALARGATDDELLELPALRCVLDEALRLHPPVWLVSRRARNADVLRGHAIRPGAQVYVPIWLLHRHPAFWDHPERFSPRRFAADASLRHAPAYLPFGLGPRHCIGGQFALLDMRCLLAHVAAALELQRVDARPVEGEAQINLRPRGPVVMRARVRGDGAARTRS
jgi:cytochrome P450